MTLCRCCFCGKEFERSPSLICGRDHLFCSRTCVDSFRKNNGTRKGKKNSEYQKQRVRECMTGERNHGYGKHQSEETKKKRSAALKGHKGAWLGKKQPREMVEKRIKKQIGHIVSIETRKKISKSNKGKKRTDSQRIANSERMIKRMKNGFFNGGTRGRWGYYYSHKNKENMFYRSSFEKKAYEILENDDSVIKYLREPIEIPYFFDGLTRKYIPDIISIKEDEKTLIEVKANWEKDSPKNTAKKLAAIEFCSRTNMKYEMWTEDYLNGNV